MHFSKRKIHSIYFVLSILLAAPQLQAENESLAVLFAYALKGNLEKVKELTTATDAKPGIDVKAKDKRFGTTALHAAARGCHMGVIKYLVKKGADINAKNKKGITPLHMTTKCQDKRNAKSTLVMLVLGADVSATSRGGNNVLHMAARRPSYSLGNQYYSYLIRFDADKSQQNKQGRLPLHYAAMSEERPNQDRYDLRHLTDKKIINTKDKDGRTPLHLAAKANRFGAVKYLIREGADFHLKDKEGKSPLDLAPPKQPAWEFIKNELHREKVAAMPRPPQKPKKKLSKEEMIKRILAQRPKLHVAIEKGNLAEVKRLIKSGANVNRTNRIRVTPLMMAINEGHDEIAILLIKSMADLEKRNLLEQTALHRAAILGRLSVVQALVKSGAKLNVKCNSNHTPLRWAKFERKFETIMYLERVGAKDY